MTLHNTTGDFRCDSCETQSSGDNFSCENPTCKFSFCAVCVEVMQEAPCESEMGCENGHPLWLQTRSFYPEGQYQCSVCKQHFAQAAGYYKCDTFQCHFDLCLKCFCSPESLVCRSDLIRNPIDSVLLFSQVQRLRSAVKELAPFSEL